MNIYSIGIDTVKISRFKIIKKDLKRIFQKKKFKMFKKN